MQTRGGRGYDYDLQMVGMIEGNRTRGNSTKTLVCPALFNIVVSGFNAATNTKM